MSSLDRSIKKVQRRLNLKPRTGYLGDGSGEVRDRANPGRYFVRFLQANGIYSAPVSIPAIANANIPVTDGVPVEIGFDANDKSVILGVNLTALAATGDNALHVNPLDDQSDGFVNQNKITTLYATRHADDVTFPFHAVVFPGLYFDDDNVLQLFAGDSVDLSGFLPASGEHCYAVVLLKTDGTLESFASTPVDSGDPLSFVDIQEALGSASTGSNPIWAFQLDGDDAVLSVDENKMVDLRVPFGPVTSGGGSSGVLFYHAADAGNTGTSETDLYSDTLVAGQLATDGDVLELGYSGIAVGSATATRQFRVYFGGTAIFDSGALALTSNGDWRVKVFIIRESSSVVRCITLLTAEAIAVQDYNQYTRVTGLTLSSTQIVKITGEADGTGAATDDIIAKLGYVAMVGGGSGGGSSEDATARYLAWRG